MSLNSIIGDCVSDGYLDDMYDLGYSKRTIQAHVDRCVMSAPWVGGLDGSDRMVDVSVEEDEVGYSGTLSF